MTQIKTPNDILSNIIDNLWRRRNMKEHIPTYHTLVYIEHLRKNRLSMFFFKIAIKIVSKEKELKNKIYR